MSDIKEKKIQNTEEKTDEINRNKGPESETWATEALEEMDDFIESQGIYIRQ